MLPMPKGLDQELLWNNLKSELVMVIEGLFPRCIGNLSTTLGMTVFKIFIWGGLKPDIKVDP